MLNFCFVTNAERGLRQGKQNSTKTSNITIEFPIRLTLFSFNYEKLLYL